jgi:glycerol-3-phosphate acyltransferase PlsX
MTRIAIDAMGGDNAPRAIVEGAVWGAWEYNVPIELVGKEDKVRAELDRIKQEGIVYNANGMARPVRIKIDPNKLDIVVTHASETIEMGEAPGQAVRKKKNSSIVLAVDSVAKGHSDAVVAAGSTGAAMASSLFGLGRLPGIDRPAICLTLPSMKKPVIIIDGGANANSTPEMLFQFGIMGSTFSKNILGVENPRIGVLNIGEERGKGNELVNTVYRMFEQKKDKLNFIGNVEGKEVFLGNCDVIVCDGFVGNVTLKTIEGASSMLFYMIKNEFKTNIISSIIGFLAKPFMKQIYKRINYEEFGGALLLGVKGITIICHGRSTSYAIKNAKEAVEKEVNKKIEAFYKETLED